MAKGFTDEYELEQRIESWNGFVDTVIDAIVNGSDQYVPLDLTFKYMVHGRTERHMQDLNAPSVVQWLDSDEVIVHIKCKEDLSQLKEGLKAIVPSESVKDLYINFQNEEMFDTYAAVIDTMFGIGFSLFMRDSVSVEMFGPTDIVPVIGKVFIGTPSSQAYDDMMELFSLAAMIDAYTESMVNSSSLRSPSLMLTADLGNFYVLNGLLDIKAAYMIDMHGETEVRVADSWVNFGFDTFFTTGLIRLTVLLRNKLGIDSRVELPRQTYKVMLEYLVTSHKYCGVILNAFDSLLSKQSEAEVRVNRAKLKETEALFQKELKDYNRYLTNNGA